ncbi:MAG TPA: CRISPR-associated ring nuclease Csm6 [Rhodothermales bacterium]|nr:CRISPR-associated ring nuclease Csm6 [Rhodothermales bacterium]
MQTYHLIALLGVTPQVITEAVWALAQRGLRPVSVYLLTTARGAAHAKALLLGKRVKDPDPRTPEPVYLANIGKRWKHLSTTLGLPLPEPRILVPEGQSSLPFDIRNKVDDQQFAELCYQTVQKVMHEADAETPVFASLAGGRKTMSAHLMSAMSVYARPIDQLIHVLLQPSHYENNHDFFYPTPATADAHIEVVYVPFPHLNSIIRERYGNMYRDGRHTRWLLHQDGIITHPDSHLHSLHITPETKNVFVVGQNAAGTTLFEQTLSPRLGMAAMLFWEASLQHPQHHLVITEAFLAQLSAQFKALSQAFRMKERTKTWTSVQEVSREVSDLNAEWRKDPNVQPLLQLKRIKSSYALIYQWRPLLPASVYVHAKASSAWPFQSLKSAKTD